GVTPRTAWQIDPFGLSEGMAALFAEAGFESHAGWRISEPEMKVMMDAKQLEFVWRGSKIAGEPTELLSTMSRATLPLTLRLSLYLSHLFLQFISFLGATPVRANFSSKIVQDLSIIHAQKCWLRSSYWRRRSAQSSLATSLTSCGSGVRSCMCVCVCVLV